MTSNDEPRVPEQPVDPVAGASPAQADGTDTEATPSAAASAVPATTSAEPAAAPAEPAPPAAAPSKPPISAPASPEPVEAAVRPSRFQRQGAWVTIVFIVLGAIAGIGALAGAINDSVRVPQAAAFDRPWDGPIPDEVFTSTQTADVTGVTSIELSGIDAGIDVRYRDVDVATLDVSGRTVPAPWTFEVRGTALVLAPSGTKPNRGDWFDFESATLTLPVSLEMTTPDLAADLASGSATIEGAFGKVDLSVDSGYLSFNGTAETVAVSVQSGAADVTTDAMAKGAFTVGSGYLNLDSVGIQPQELRFDVDSGVIDAQLPTGAYAVELTGDASAVHNGLPTGPGTPARVTANVMSGALTLTES